MFFLPVRFMSSPNTGAWRPQTVRLLGAGRYDRGACRPCSIWMKKRYVLFVMRLGLRGVLTTYDSYTVILIFQANRHPVNHYRYASAEYNRYTNACAPCAAEVIISPLSASSPARLPASLNRVVFMHPANRLRSRHTRPFA